MRPRARIAAALGIALSACGASVPTPAVGPHVDEEPVTVPYPPPAAQVEVIPSPTADLTKPVWVDGEWQWKSRRWVWQAGQWEAPIAGGYYAPAVTIRQPDGTLVYYQGAWKGGAKGK